MTTTKTTTKRPAAAKTAKSPKPAAATKPAATATVASASPQTSRIPAPPIKPAAITAPPVSMMSSMTDTDHEDTPVLKKQELIDRVVLASGAKKKDVKPIVEAALAVLGDALSAGEELNLPPLGKAKVNRRKEDGPNEILVIKLRRNDNFGGGGTGGDTSEGASDTDADSD